MEKETYFNVFCRFRIDIAGGEVGGIHTCKTKAEANAEFEKLVRLGFGKPEKKWEPTPEQPQQDFYEAMAESLHDCMKKIVKQEAANAGE